MGSDSTAVNCKQTLPGDTVTLLYGGPLYSISICLTEPQFAESTTLFAKFKNKALYTTCNGKTSIVS